MRCHVRANETPESVYCQNCQFRRRDVKRSFQVGTLKGTQEGRNRRGFCGSPSGGMQIDPNVLVGEGSKWNCSQGHDC